MYAKDINAKWQAEINTWVAHDKTHQSTSEEHKKLRDKIFNGKAKWWYDPYDTTWNVMTNDDIPVEIGQRYIYIGETYKMKKVKPYKDEEESNKMQMIQMKVGETLAQNENGTWTIVPKRTPISKRVGKAALVYVVVLEYYLYNLFVLAFLPPYNFEKKIRESIILNS